MKCRTLLSFHSWAHVTDYRRRKEKGLGLTRSEKMGVTRKEYWAKPKGSAGPKLAENGLAKTRPHPYIYKVI